MSCSRSNLFGSTACRFCATSAFPCSEHLPRLLEALTGSHRIASLPILVKGMQNDSNMEQRLTAK